LSSNVKIVAQYRDYAPPVEIYRCLRILLQNVPKEHLAGLYKITLTNSECLRESYQGKLQLGKRRIRPADCRGLYQRGHILLLVDQIFMDCSELFLLFPPIKTYLLGEVLYHEIGHHIHRLQEPGYRADKEAFADEWKDKLLRSFISKRYWYFSVVSIPYQHLIHPIVAWFRKRNKRKDMESDQRTA
jgi:hypothetical protein